MFSRNDGNDLSEAPSGPAMMTRKKLFIFIVLNSVAFVQAFDATCICVTLPTIAEVLNATVSETLSLGTAFLLAMTVSQPIFTELAFVCGKKAGYLVAIGIFIVGTVMCGVAKSSTVLLIGRTIQGVGAGGPQPLSAMILTDLFPGRARAQYVSFMNVSWALGTILGPILGGILTESDRFGWRWIFWITCPFLCFSGIAAWFLFGNDGPKTDKLYRLKWVDWTGTSVFVTSAGLLLISLVWGGSRYAWDSIPVLAPLILSIIGFVGFLLYEVKGARKPVFPLIVFKHNSTNIQFFCTMVHGILMWMILYYMSIFYLGVKRLSPTMTGVWALPATLTVAPMAITVGLFLKKRGSYRWFLYFGWSLTITILGVMSLINSETPDYALLLMTGFLGVGFGVLIPAMSGNIQATVPPRAVGHAIATCYVLRAAGQCFGVAIGQGIFSHRLEQELRKMGEDPSSARDLMREIQGRIKTNGAAEDEEVAVVMSLQTMWVAACAIAAAAGILTLFVRCPRIQNHPEDLGQDPNEPDSMQGMRPLDYRSPSDSTAPKFRSILP